MRSGLRCSTAHGGSATYGVLADRFHRLEIFTRCALLGSAIGSVMSFIAEMPRSVGLVFGLFVGGVVVFDSVMRTAHTAATLSLIRDECGRLKLALNDLWRTLPTLEDSEAERLLKELNSNLHHITAMDPTPEREKVNRVTTEAVFEQVKASGYVC